MYIKGFRHIRLLEKLGDRGGGGGWLVFAKIKDRLGRSMRIS